jgi:hypothetical protein
MSPEPESEEHVDGEASVSGSVEDVDTLPGEVEDPRPPSLSSRRQRVVGDSQVRGWLAGSLTAVFAVTVLASLGTAIFGGHQAESQVVDVLRDLLPAELAILGSAIGFYFGSR